MKYLTSSLYDFEKLIRGGYLYVDKTEYVWKMVQTPFEAFFFSRPRRFGKSLLVSTLKAVFEGKRELFQGLAIYDKPYDWKKYPVIHLDLGDCSAHTASDLREYLSLKLQSVARKHGVDTPILPTLLATSFSCLIEELSRSAPVVILIDEYDMPILQNLTRGKELVAIRDTLSDFYAALKTQQSNERFVFLTGVSKFCHVSLFSKLNSLVDISRDARFATMLGYTQEEFVENFAEYLAQTEAKQELLHEEYLSRIKRWYDGFRFEECSETVYNPVSLANFFLYGGKFNNYWFATGTASFLMELIKRRSYDFEKALREPVSEVAFSAYEVDNLEVLPLLLQTGYLTIHHTECVDEQTLFYLDFPNMEVRESFETYLINAYTRIESSRIQARVRSMKELVSQGDVDGFVECLQSLLAEIPYSIQVCEERYYQTVVYLIFLLLGVYATAEAQTNKGRVDAVAACGDWVYLFEFKLNKSEEVAFEQILDRQYYKKYQFSGKKIVLIGANFNFASRSLSGWKSKTL